jgi:arginine decarboxylase
MLIGAYQEVMGNNHNLFGTPNEAQIHIDDDGYLIKKVIRGTTVGEAVGRARYERGLLHDGFRRQVAHRIKNDELSEAEGADLVNFYESRFDAYTYITGNSSNRTKGRRRHDY